MRKTYTEKKRKSKFNIDPNNSNKIKEKEAIKTQSDIEKELDIRSYSEYRIKDDDSSKDYVDEDVEAKMIRLVILKKNGGNVLDNINLIRKKIKSKDFPKINKALSIIEKIDIRKKIKKLFIILKSQRIQTQKKPIQYFLQKFKKYIWKIYLKKYFFYFNKSLINNSELVLSKVKSKKKNNSILITPHASRKKIKKYNNKNIKLELITKKSSLPKKMELIIS